MLLEGVIFKSVVNSDVPWQSSVGAPCVLEEPNTEAVRLVCLSRWC